MAPVASTEAAVPAAPQFNLVWEDSQAEVTVTVYVGDRKVSGADVGFRLQRRHLRVSIHGVAACDGELASAVDPADSFWCLEQEAGKTEEAPPRRKLVVTLTKAIAAQPWLGLWKEEAEDAGKGREAARSIVIGSSWDVGDEEAVEDVEEQRQLESELEPRYLELVRKKGLEDEETLDTFFRLYNEKIQLYKLTELEAYLKDVVPVCRRKGGLYRIQAEQALATVLVKQGRVREALDIFLELERRLGAKDPALVENIAFGYLTLGDLKASEQRHRQALRLQEALNKPARGSTLLGLGYTYYRMGRLKEAREFMQKANDYYLEAAQGRPSSLQAKCGVALASVHEDLGELETAARYLREAVPVYEVTCGKESPLIGSALEKLGPLLQKLGREEEARPVLHRAYELQVAKDAWSFDTAVGLHMRLLLSHMRGVTGDTLVDRTQFREYVGVVDRLVARVRKDDTPGRAAKLAPALKMSAEVKAYCADYAGAVTLLEEALPLMRAAADAGDKAVATAVRVTERLLRLCEACRSGRRTPPMRLSPEDPEYALLLPPSLKAMERLRAQRAGEAAAQAAQARIGAGAVSTPGPVIEDLDENAGSGDRPDPGAERPQDSQEAKLAALELFRSAARDARSGNRGGGSGTSTSSSRARPDVTGRLGPEAPRCRELRADDLPVLERLWAESGAERLFPSEDLLSRHLAANAGLSFVAERRGEVVGLTVAGAAGPLGIVRQVIYSQLPQAESRQACPLAMALAAGVREALLDRTTAALRRAGCTSVEVMVPVGEPQEFWERHARGPALSAYTL